MKLSQTDTVIAAVPQFIPLSGWTETPIWVIVQDGNGILRIECLQPKAQTIEMKYLFEVAEASQRILTGVIETKFKKQNKEEK